MTKLSLPDTALEQSLQQTFPIARLAASVVCDGQRLGYDPTELDGPAPLPGDYTAKWTAGDHQVTLTIARADGAAFQARDLQMRISMPLMNYGHVIVPDCGRHYINSDKALDMRAPSRKLSANNVGHPFFAATDETENMRLAFGLISQACEVEFCRVYPRISTRKALVGGDNDLTLSMAWKAPAEPVEELEIELFLTDEADSWFHALRSYTNLLKQRGEITYPDHPEAWKPTWCNWTAFDSADLNRERLIENGRLCKELGVNTVIIDDGWFGPGLDDDFHGDFNIGDYYADPAKFSDLPGVIAELQDMGLKVLLWHAPLCIAETAEAFESLKPYLVHKDGEPFVSVNGLHQLCPAYPAVREYVARETRRLLEEFKPDGFKVDLYNCLSDVLCDSPEHSHEHDRHDWVDAVDATMRAQWEAAREVKPDVLIELKQDYGHTQLLQYGTMVRAGDTAYDVDTNLRRCAYQQSYAYAVHNDYLVTHYDVEPENLAILMARTLIAGVPTLGMDLPRLDSEQLAVIRHWLGVYNDNVELFKQPREPQSSEMTVWQAVNGDTAWVGLTREAREWHWPTGAKRVLLINATSRDYAYLRINHTTTARVTPVGQDASQAVEMIDGCRIPLPVAEAAWIELV